ncbi:MAG: serine/threonine protein kinase [Pseudoxanthomonas sp.]
MDNDTMHLAWQALGRQLERHNALQLQALRERKLGKARTSLWPLALGQLAQIVLLGVPFITLAGLLWHHLGQPGTTAPWTTVLAGITMQAYGVAATALAGATLGRILAMDYAAPVLEIQKRLAALRRLYVVNGMVAGLPWWFLWVPVLMTLSGLANVDLYARAPSMVWIGLGVGAAGLLATAWFHRWSRSPRRPRLARALEDSLSGGSLRRARGFVDELAQFERD